MRVPGVLDYVVQRVRLLRRSERRVRLRPHVQVHVAQQPRRVRPIKFFKRLSALLQHDLGFSI